MPLTPGPPWRLSWACLGPSTLLTLDTMRSPFQGPAESRKVKRVLITFNLIFIMAVVVAQVVTTDREVRGLIPTGSWAFSSSRSLSLLLNVCQSVVRP